MVCGELCDKVFCLIDKVEMMLWWHLGRCIGCVRFGFGEWVRTTFELAQLSLWNEVIEVSLSYSSCSPRNEGGVQGVDAAVESRGEKIA